MEYAIVFILLPKHAMQGATEVVLADQILECTYYRNVGACRKRLLC